VRSIIAELQTEQYKGLLPEFNFIALNGMELRHPFDAYVKLWEAISGTRKERLSAGDAVYELENYFCGDLQKGGISHSDSEDEFSQDDNNGDISEPPVTVLMLDEIDYLITKKETLVYNFFDWPLRGKQNENIYPECHKTLLIMHLLSRCLSNHRSTSGCRNIKHDKFARKAIDSSTVSHWWRAMSLQVL
jgi:Cdc6-like AAA superfamily ATPase